MQALRLFLIVFVVFVSSCSEDFLDKRPLVNQTVDTFFKTEAHAVAATNANYSMLRDWQVHVFSYIGMTDIISDDADKGSTPNDASFLLELDNLNHGPANVAPTSVWSGYYRAIYRANLAIQEIPTIDMDSDRRDELVAENRFLRGYYYFNLVRWFGDVPLITRPLNPDEYNQTRTPKEEVYRLIIDDLQFAADILPEKSEYPLSELGRATRGAALGMLAKVQLTLRQWQAAADAVELLLDSEEYSLLPRYEEIFTMSGEHSSGSIFEVSTVSLGTGEGGSQYNQVQGVRGTPNLGWGFNRPSDDLISSFPPNDPRLEATILYRGEVLPDGSQVVIGDPGIAVQRHNQKAWVPLGAGGVDNGGGNIRILRLADVLLIGAEAYNELDDLERALELANLVRARARGDLPARFLPDLEPSTKEEAREAIWYERRLELALEQQRWFDLVRTGRAQEILERVGKTWNDRYLLFPIPQSEIDLSGGSLQQNPGY